MKKLAIIAAAAFVLTGCTSTLTVGPNANKGGLLNADASTDGVSVTVPWVKASVNNELDSLKDEK